MAHIAANATKTFSSLCKLGEYTKNSFPTKLRLENNFFVQKLEKKISKN